MDWGLGIVDDRWWSVERGKKSKEYLAESVKERSRNMLRGLLFSVQCSVLNDEYDSEKEPSSSKVRAQTPAKCSYGGF